MTKLAQEASDRYLAELGGVDDLIMRGVAEFGDAAEEAPGSRRSLSSERDHGRRGAVATPLGQLRRERDSAVELI